MGEGSVVAPAEEPVAAPEEASTSFEPEEGATARFESGLEPEQPMSALERLRAQQEGRLPIAAQDSSAETIADAEPVPETAPVLPEPAVSQAVQPPQVMPSMPKRRVSGV